MGQYEEIREMLKKSKNLLTENSKLSDYITPAEDVIKEEQKKFRETITPHTTFDTLKISTKRKDVIFIGKIFDKITWEFNLREANGVYIDSENLKLDRDNIEILKKLYGYYQAWSDEWAEKLSNEYGNSL